MNVARSARENHEVDISTDAPKKPELVDRMAEEGIHLDNGIWMVGDEEIDRLESNPSPDRDGPSEPQPEVVLYAQTRAGATKDRIEEIEDALGEIGYKLRDNDRSDNLSIIVPPESEEEPIDPEEVTRDEVYEMAKDLDIDGRSDMSKQELVEAVEAER
ncbi:Rho termination factor N-terminal domain-containing protein [Natronococcus sp. A-GB7]|uniref:Rho termination factor N-terminal domain-containing protein n=1 Tax=Natronococcus sp. A-GB7 TaxID=3037649 RepID=UPI00241C3453|nr:Rho termination factor N-terminal domain-containing protein [Natronococcus sp. A-GB7]MDG5818519.1 hypothetical protein [Natronococcus sp. A-GB7]